MLVDCIRRQNLKLYISLAVFFSFRHIIDAPFLRYHDVQPGQVLVVSSKKRPSHSLFSSYYTSICQVPCKYVGWILGLEVCVGTLIWFLIEFKSDQLKIQILLEQ